MEGENTARWSVSRGRAFRLLTALNLLAVWLALPRPVSAVSLVLGGMVGALLVAVGLAAAGPFGRGAPLLEGSTRDGRGGPGAARRLGLGLIAGALTGGFLLAVLVYALVPVEPSLGARLHARAGAPLWQPLALAVESSILEEIPFRLFLMSGLVWLFSRGWRRGEGESKPAVVWTAVLLSALAFGLIHLPAWLAAAGLTPLLVGCVLLLNGVAGIVLGQVYWRLGIEAAILCHFAADMVVQGLGPRLLA